MFPAEWLAGIVKKLYTACKKSLQAAGTKKKRQADAGAPLYVK
jgi:hypothetical protein